jgi:hypothetical protein
MRILMVILSLSALSQSALGQGIVNFANSPSTLVSYWTWEGSHGLISGSNSWYFGLLIRYRGVPGSFVFSGVYATNSPTAPGRFVNNAVAVPNTAPGDTIYYEVAAWGSSLGPTFNPDWLKTSPSGPFALSAVGSGVLGGGENGKPPIPPLPLFGGAGGITSGFTFCCLTDIQILTHGSFGVGQNGFEFPIIGLANTPIVIEASTNLAVSSWVPLLNGVLSNGMVFGDSQWTNYPARFYRVRSL